MRGAVCTQGCHIDIKEEDVTDLMVEEGFCHEAEAIMRVDTFKRCLLHVSIPCASPLQPRPNLQGQSVLVPKWACTQLEHRALGWKTVGAGCLQSL